MLDGSISRTRAIPCHSQNVKKIYYQYNDEVKAPPAESVSGAPPSAPLLLLPLPQSLFPYPPVQLPALRMCP